MTLIAKLYYRIVGCAHRHPIRRMTDRKVWTFECQDCGAAWPMLSKRPVPMRRQA